MLFSFLKLAELAKLPKSVSVEEVVQAINSVGFEVESFTATSKARGVKFGKVLNTSKNPNGDQLTVCEVEFEDKKRTIQTAATNVAAGKTVIAFVPGASNGEVVYGAKTLKGVLSEGMLASLVELGVPTELLRPENAQGVMTFDEAIDLKHDPLAWLGLNDYVIDVTVLSNRADANSYFAMALELSAYFGTNFELPKLRADTFTSTLKVSTGKAESLAFLEVEAASPISLQEQILLAKSKLKSVNDIVDLTNLAFLMSGQPVHAYDKAQVSGAISAHYVSETVSVFGDKSVNLQNDLVITANNVPIAIAGVIGLQKYPITNETKSFYVELGRFKITDVRHAVRAVRLSTQASVQSSREFNVALTYWAAAYIGTKASRVSSLINAPALKLVQIPLDTKRINALIGEADFNQSALYAKALDSLSRLAYEFKQSAVTVAPHIANVTNTQDLVEEIMRYVGYDNLAPLEPSHKVLATTPTNTLKERMVAAGYLEVITHSLVTREIASFNPHGFRKVLHLNTFVATDHESLRSSAAPSLAMTLDYHEKRKLMPLSIGEVSYLGGEVHALTLASQVKTLREVQNDLVNLLQQEVTFKPWSHPDLHPGFSAQVFLRNQVIGWIGKFYPGKYVSNPLVAEVRLDFEVSKAKITMTSHDQLRTRDLTFKLNRSEQIGEVVDKLSKIVGVVNVWQIDEYKATDGERSVTLRISGDTASITAIDKIYN